jgi:hypothetical protein
MAGGRPDDAAAIPSLRQARRNPLDRSAIHASLCLRQYDARVSLWGKAPDKAQHHERNDEMASKELEITSTTYIMAGVGAVIMGGLAAAALGGLQNTIAAAVVGGLAGGCLGLFF